MLTPSAVVAYRIASSIERLIATHYDPRTAYTRTGSPTPFISCSPRSSNSTPADKRAIPRTTSDTRISRFHAGSMT